MEKKAGGVFSARIQQFFKQKWNRSTLVMMFLAIWGFKRFQLNLSKRTQNKIKTSKNNKTDYINFMHFLVLSNT